VKKLSIIIPAYREEGRIGQSIEEIDRWITESGMDPEVRIIVEKSPDNTLEVARRAVEGTVNSACFNVVDNLVHRGKGYAVRCGVLSSSGDFRLFMDADLSVPLREVRKAVDAIGRDGGPDLVIGTRYGSGGKIVKRQGTLRRVGSRVYNILLRILGLTGIEDTQCGFKVLRAESAEIFNQCQIDGFGFDIELLMIARKAGKEIEQIPVEWHNAEGSKFDPVRDGFRTVVDAFRVKWRLS
jgi:dolichyl-phosphate beta-glucosyltransferase